MLLPDQAVERVIVMRKFIYFEQTDGGMETTYVKTIGDLESIYGWMSKICKKDDEELLNWMMFESEVGEIFNHRIGYLVRLKNGDSDR
jgi:hypothetical protein